jgi:hypothetical protein
VAHGPRAHLFYVGDVQGADFKNFELKAEVLTHPRANSGIYFHTRYREKGWPDRGYEAQVNNTHSDRRKTGGLYGVQDVLDQSPVSDNQWFTYHITVQGKHIVIRINDQVTCDYTEPADLDRPERQLSRGTFALQGHDPKSRVAYRKIMVRPLPDDVAQEGFTDLFNGKDLTGWEQKNGKARYFVEDGVIVGESVPNTPNSFLCTTRHYGDFILEFEYLLHPDLNSGVQIRSNSLPEYKNGRVHGYQCELENENRKRYWTAGIYDEGRRGWLYPAKGDKESGKRFAEQGDRLLKRGDWNRVRVRCEGDSIKTWLNGEPRADLKDGMTASGFIGLQVHGVGGRKEPMQVRWRNLRIKTLD